MTTLTGHMPNNTTALVVAGAALVGVILGAVVIPRGPQTGAMLPFEATAVTMQDGSVLNVQTREVTVAEWQGCYLAGACDLDLSANLKTADYPATGLNFLDAMQFVAWINTFDTPEWRLPTMAEWNELAAEVMPPAPDPIFTDPTMSWASSYLTEASRSGRALRASGGFSTTSAGLVDMDGSVWEWTQDCYAGADGQGATMDLDRCPAFYLGGEHEAVMPFIERDPAQGGCAVGAPPAHLGIRLVSARR
jgi:formylglycine-generating enzyme required for sulfatase activity